MSAIPIQTMLSTTPKPIILVVPYFLISDPVKKPGANMPITCHSSTKAVSEKGRPHICMARGVAAINIFMTP